MSQSSDIIAVDSKVLFEIAKKAGFKEEVPTIEQFIDDPYYLGKVLGDGLYPIWREAAKKLYPNPYHSPYDEVILSGAIGLGKSTMALLITFYDLCRVMCLEDPHKHYDLISSTVITFPMMNATKSLASKVLWSQFVDWVEASPFFKHRVDTRKGAKTFFKGNIDVSTGSRGSDYLGQATIGAIFSEINDMTVVAGQAEDNLDTISTRRDSRFGGKGKEILGHIILDSSNKGNRSFIDARLEEKEKKGSTGHIVFSFSHWEAKWHLGGYSGKFFQVYAGDEFIDPFIIDDSNSDLLPNLKPNRIVDVPVEHREQFEFNIIKSLRDLAGVSTFGTASFISSNEILNRTFIRPNPVTKDLIVLDFFNDQSLRDYIDIGLLKTLCDKPRFIHIDLGLTTDSTGIACSYIDRYEEVKSYDPVKGVQTVVVEPIFVNEWLMEIRSIPGQEVPIHKIKKFILDARAEGYPIACVSTDGFQSTNLRQDLLYAGFEVKLISVDRTKDPYFHLRSAILEGRATAVASEKLKREIRELEEHDDKFDHPPPPAGSKDLSDALCGSIWSAKENMQLADKTKVTKQQADTLLKVLEKSAPKEQAFRARLMGSF